MQSFEVRGGKKLSGEITPQGAKNEALQIISAVLLSAEKITVSNIPDIVDVNLLIELLGEMNVKINRQSCDTCTFQADDVNVDYLHSEAYHKKSGKLRGSVMLAGPLLARFKKAYIPKPGGDKIGRRRLDTHIIGFEKLGAKFSYHTDDGFFHLESADLKGANILLDEPSVTGTANILMAASMAVGTTTIYNAACEPYIQQLCKMLNRMGAKIEGLDTDTLVVTGVEKLHGCEYAVVADRIETGSYLAAAAITGGRVKTTHTDPTLMESVLEKFEEMGAEVTRGDDWIELDMMGKRPKAVSFQTLPHPDFPTDMQAQIMAVNAIGRGFATISETIFENRFMHVPELSRMGANIQVEGNDAVVTGVEKLSAAPVMATDLRASFSLVLAALAADGETLIDRIYHIDRGYEDIEAKLQGIGAQIKRVSS